MTNFATPRVPVPPPASGVYWAGGYPTNRMVDKFLCDNSFFGTLILFYVSCTGDQVHNKHDFLKERE